ILACEAPGDPGVERHGFAAKADVDIRRSLVVTEQPILARFSFERVMNQLVAQSGVPGLTAGELFTQWWDTQNASPGKGLGPNCDTVLDSNGQPAINDYPYDCPRGEGAEADSDPFTAPETNPGAYVPIGLFNRFDLAPAGGSNCGEHRIVYARRSGMDLTQNHRNLLIFEATLPNPHVRQGLKGCHKIAKFWADLTKEDNIDRRADDLEHFYFEGIANVPAVVHLDHYGAGPTGVGQIRSNQFMNLRPGDVTPKLWTLREFKMQKICAGGACTALKIVPVSDETNPFGPLFSPAGIHAQTAAFQEHFLTQVVGLATGSITGINFKVPNAFNTGQSHASAASNQNQYLVQLGAGDSAFRTAIAAAIPADSGLAVDDIVLRAQALSCAGCHRLNNNVPIGGTLVWPPSLGFTHVTERETEDAGGGMTRFRISLALLDVFLPKRKQVLDDFMNDKPPNAKNPKDPIGGRRVH
ncbi:MAG: hypothetical protein ACREX8_06135, partial [Gammaproteobacteria bacterium]